MLVISHFGCAAPSVQGCTSPKRRRAFGGGEGLILESLGGLRVTLDEKPFTHCGFPLRCSLALAVAGRAWLICAHLGAAQSGLSWRLSAARRGIQISGRSNDISVGCLQAHLRAFSSQVPPRALWETEPLPCILAPALQPDLQLTSKYGAGRSEAPQPRDVENENPTSGAVRVLPHSNLSVCSVQCTAMASRGGLLDKRGHEAPWSNCQGKVLLASTLEKKQRASACVT